MSWQNQNCIIARTYTSGTRLAHKDFKEQSQDLPGPVACGSVDLLINVWPAHRLESRKTIRTTKHKFVNKICTLDLLQHTHVNAEVFEKDGVSVCQRTKTFRQGEGSLRFICPSILQLIQQNHFCQSTAESGQEVM